MHPPFSFRLRRKENGPCTVQKKRRLCPNPARWAGLDRNGGRASRCPQNLPDFCRVRLNPGEQRGCFPAFGGLGAAFGVQNRKAPACWPRAFRFAKRYPGGCGSAFGGAFPASRFEHRRAAAAGRGKSNQICCPFPQLPVAGAQPKVSAELCPRPTLKLPRPPRVSCWDPTYLSKPAHRAGFGHPAPFFWTVHGPFSFGKTERKWGVHPPVP